MQVENVFSNGGQQTTLSTSLQGKEQPLSWPIDQLNTEDVPSTEAGGSHQEGLSQTVKSTVAWDETLTSTDPTTNASNTDLEQLETENTPTGKTTIEWAENAEEMEKVLKSYMQRTSSRFTSWKTTKGFLRDVTDISKYKITFEDAKVKTRPEQQIKYDGTPYVISGQKIYECEFGVDRNVSTKKRLLDLKAVEMLRKLSGQDDPDPTGEAKVIKRRGSRFCKKFGCPVKITLRDVVFFPEYKSKGNTEKYKRKVTKALTKDWMDKKKIEMQRKIIIPLPSEDQHQNHPPNLDQKAKRRRNRKKSTKIATNEPDSNYDVTEGPDDDVMNATADDVNVGDGSGLTMVVSGFRAKHIPIWSRCMLNLVKRLNNYHQPGSSKELCRPLMIKNMQCGMIPLPVLSELQSNQETFQFEKDEKTGNIKFVTINEQLTTAEQRTQAVDRIIREFREKKLFATLNGWRDELYAVSSSYGNEVFLEMERSATCLFGVHRYGVHVNGFVRNGKNEFFMWIGKRSDNKQTWPGKLDNTVGGGLASRMTVQTTLVKECIEEAAIPEELARHARPAGTVSYTYEDERGIFPETQFVFDLELPESFQPVNIDGEVQAFYLLTIDEVKTLIATDEFKPNCALIILDFLIRHGFIDPDAEPYYTDFIKGLHS